MLGSTFQITSIGKYLIAEETNKICDCFSAALASIEAQGTVSSNITKIVSKWCKPSYEDDEDSQYNSKISRRLTSELCVVAEKHSLCGNFVSEHAENMLFNFLKTLMDSSRLEKLPSCNLKRISESSGRLGKEQALLMLDLFNDDSFQGIDDEHQGDALRKLQNKRRKGAIEIWSFCSRLGTAFVKIDSADPRSITKMGNPLLNLDGDLLREFNFLDNIISLENETFKTFRLLRNIVSYSSTNYDDFVRFERVSSFSLLLIANHILNIVQSLKYNDQTSSDKEYKRATLTELLNSFIELFVSSSTWILQEGAENDSKTWFFFIGYLRDRIFSPILRRQEIDTTVVLQEFALAARFVLNGPYGEEVKLPAINCVGLIGCSKYLGNSFFTSILRRSKQLLIATALNKQNLGLQNALLEAVLGSSDDLEDAAPWIVGTKFPLRKSRSIGNQFVWPYSSPVQKQIDNYLEFVDENLTSLEEIDRDDHWSVRASMKKSFLKNHVIPRLQSSSLGMDKKRRLILLLGYIFEYDAQITSDDLSRERTLNIEIVLEIIKALRSHLHHCLMQPCVNNSVASVIFSCSMHLASSRLILEDEIQNLVRWSHVKTLGANGKTILDLSSSEIIGTYVWIYFQWLRTLGDLVVNENTENLATSETFLLMRKRWQETRCCRLGGMDEERLDLGPSNSLETLDRLIIEFEDLALPPKTKIGKSSIVNIYAKAPTSHYRDNKNDETPLFEQWVPSVIVKKSLKELMAIILSTS